MYGRFITLHKYETLLISSLLKTFTYLYKTLNGPLFFFSYLLYRKTVRLFQNKIELVYIDIYNFVIKNKVGTTN